MLGMLLAVASLAIRPSCTPPFRLAAVAARLPPVCLQAAMPSFDTTLRGMLDEAKACGSMETAVDTWLDQLDDAFIPELGARIEAARAVDPSELEQRDAPSLTQLSEAMEVLQDRSARRFELARDQLQSLLGAGEINKMDAQLAGMVRRGEIDAGFFYVLFRNLEDAQRSGDEGGARLISHIHTRLQEELEKKAAPALALLHKLTRLDESSIRDNVLRHNLVPQKSAPLPGGGELPLAKPAPAMVPPMDFAAAIEGAIEKVLALPLDRDAIESTAEEIRQVAKEARAVIADEYDSAMLDAFTEALTPAFARALPPKPAGEPKLANADGAAA